MEFSVAKTTLSLIEGDITRVPADAIVNAANSGLVGGGGVDGAIHRAGGPSIMKELDVIRAEIGRCLTGDAVVTGAGNLPAQYVIHTVGPVYRDGRHQEPEQLASCYRTSLRLAEERGAKSVTFPSISTGVYGYPMAEAAEVALHAAGEYLRRPDCTLEKVTFVLFGAAALETHREAARREFGLSSD
jgi:O-acetyl-ADP-ribose deacetylase (regulator of RNase III)